MSIDYGFTCRLRGEEFAQVVTRVTEALQREGFGVLSDIDVQATLKKKLGVEFRPYRILGACNPTIAHKAIEGEPWVGLLLPCNIVIQQREDGEILIGFQDPATLVGCSGNKGLEPIATEARQKLHRVMQALGSSPDHPAGCLPITE